VASISSILLYPWEPIEQETGWAAEAMQVLEKTLPDGVEIMFVYYDLHRPYFNASVRYVKAVAEIRGVVCGASEGDVLCFMCCRHQVFVYYFRYVLS
jgi:hypothetical protein